MVSSHSCAQSWFYLIPRPQADLSPGTVHIFCTVQMKPLYMCQRARPVRLYIDLYIFTLRWRVNDFTMKLCIMSHFSDRAVTDRQS